MSRIALVAAISLLLACGENSGGGTGGGSGSSSLAGTWDVTVTGNNVGHTGTLTGVVTLDATHLSIEFAGSMLTYQLGASTFHWSGRDVVDIDTTHSAAAMDVGAFAFPLGGSWTFASPQEPTHNCSANFAANGIDLLCNLQRTDLESNFPLRESAHGTLTGLKSASGTSIFGDLSGTWTFSDGNGASFGTIKFSGSTIFFNMTNQSEFAGGFSITFNNGVATGTSTDGAEVSARLR